MGKNGKPNYTPFGNKKSGDQRSFGEKLWDVDSTGKSKFNKKKNHHDSRKGGGGNNTGKRK